MTQILIVGATSAMARGCAFAWAAQGQRVLLAGRDDAELARLAQDIRVRFNTAAQVVALDLDETTPREAWLADLQETYGQIDGLLCAAGWMPDNETMRHGMPALQVIQRNFTGPVALINAFADVCEQRKHGFIVGISSVAGDRGRQSNYLYGAAKGGFAIYLAGLRNRLFASGVSVLTVKPGFVDTRMTFGLPGLFLVADPFWVGQQIVAACDKGRDEIYVPGFWRLILLIIRHVPEVVFKRLKL
ncbi:MAG: SDR family oxidoreductase [Pseudomonadota bacterium]